MSVFLARPLYFLSALIVILAPSLVTAQTKVKSALVRELQAGERVRVIILTRPEFDRRRWRAGSIETSRIPVRRAWKQRHQR